jgi:hypothetical protein
MKPASNPGADEQVVEAITKLREIQKVFAGTPTRDLPFCTPISLIREYQDDSQRLRRHGNQVIGNRSLHFAMLTTIKAHWNIQMAAA